MSLVARVLEAGGISTVTFTAARDIAASAGNPRQIFLNYPLGNPAGRPHDLENQRSVLRAGLMLLENADRPGMIVDLPFAWSESNAWMEKFMTEEQPFISRRRGGQAAGAIGKCTETEGQSIAVARMKYGSKARHDVFTAVLRPLQGTGRVSDRQRGDLSIGKMS